MKVCLITLDQLEIVKDIPHVTYYERVIYAHNYGKYGACAEGESVEEINPLRTRIYQRTTERYGVDSLPVYREQIISSDWAMALDSLRDIILKAKQLR